MTHFAEEEEKILSQYVTNVGGDIFALKNLPGIAGAVYARYSRSKTGFQETLLREFVKEGMVDPEHANELIERVLVAYGDDSVGELEGAHVSFENISILSTKEIEDRRIGGSPIEKSTRYVFFDEKDPDGTYKYVREPKIMASPYAEKYVTTMDFIFDTYKSLVEPMQHFYQELFPFDKAEYDVLGTGTKQKYSDLSEEKDQKAFRVTYKIDQKTKACDALRCLLPLATKTNVGMFGNGRYFQGVISHLISTPYPEVVQIGEKLMAELSKIIPQYVRRAKPKTYNVAIDTAMKAVSQELLGGMQAESSASVSIVPMSELHTEEFLIANMLYSYSQLPLEQLIHAVIKMPRDVRDRIKNTYTGTRETRRDRPGRALESGYPYTLDLVADFGTYKDLMRHRMNTQMRQPFNPNMGFVVPDDLKDAGFEKEVLACHERTVELYNTLYPELGEVASYVALHGTRVRWLMGMNTREAMHMLELRTTKQGHPQYRRLCQQIHTALTEIDHWGASTMLFVDHNSYDSARGDSEARQRVKEKGLDAQFGSHSDVTATI